jgi:hypothetical protein
LLVLAAQFVVFAAWSQFLADRFSLTFDFATNGQAWYLIAHGDLNPFNSTQNHYFWQGHSEFIMWPLALFYWVWPHFVTLLWLQDAGIIVAEAVAFAWGCELAAKYLPGSWLAPVLAATGLVLLVANPWTWAAVSFDFHTECISAAFLVLLARDLWAGRRRAWAWIVPTLLCGDVAAAYMAAIGVGGLLVFLAARGCWRLAGIRSRLAASRRDWLPSLVVVGIGFLAVVISKVIHGDQSSPLWTYLYLQSPHSRTFSMTALIRGLVTHPGNTLHVLWSKRGNTWLNVASGGLLGVLFGWALPVTLVVLVTNDLTYGSTFNQPGFQSELLYILLPAGTVGALAWLARRWRVVALALAAAVLVDALAITAINGPMTKTDWVRVRAPVARTLSEVLARIPASDEVIASQGVVGRFGARTDVKGLFGPARIGLDGSTTWVIVVPYQGVEPMSPRESLALIGQMERLHASLVVQSRGVWAFRWTPPRGMTILTVP